MTLIFTASVVIFVFVFDASRKTRFPIDAFRFSLFFYVLLYFLIPELLPLSYACHPFCGGVPWIPRVVALVGLAALVSGYYLSHGVPVFQVSPKVKISDRREKHFILLALLISGVSLVLYAGSYGGFLSAFSFGALQRIGGKNEVDVGSAAVAQYFVGIAYIVLAMSQYQIYKKRKNRNLYIALIVVSLMILLSYALIKGGRGAFFTIIMLGLFVHINLYGIRLNFRKVLLLLLMISLGLWVVAYGKKGLLATASIFRGESMSAAFTAIETKEARYAYGRLISEFSHPIKSLGVVIETDIDFNMMKHFWVAPLHLIPTKLLGIDSGKPYRISEENTELLTGSPDGGIPPGLLASFWYGGGLLGGVAGFIFFGGAIGWMQRQCYAIIKVYPSAIPIVIYLFFKVPWFINNGDLSVFLKHQFDLFIFFMLLVFFSFWCRIRLLGHKNGWREPLSLS